MAGDSSTAWYSRIWGETENPPSPIRRTTSLDFEDQVLEVRRERDSLKQKIQSANERISKLEKTLGSYAIVDGRSDRRRNKEDVLATEDSPTTTLFELVFQSADSTFFHNMCNCTILPFRSQSTVYSTPVGCLFMPVLEGEDDSDEMTTPM